MAQDRPEGDAAGARGPGRPGGDGGGPDDRTRAVAAAGRAAFPGVDLPLGRLAARLAGCPAPPPHAADLYLACACAEGLPAALRLFEERVLSQVPAAVAHLRAGPDFGQDVCQQVRERLFVGSAEGPPRISSYEGRGPLGGWVRAMAVRLALNLREKKDEHAAHPGEQVIEKLVGATCDPELEILKARYRGAFREAVRDAAAGLPDEQRAVLHLYLVEGLGTQRIGALYNVNHSTVSRWLQAARDAIFSRTRQLLGERLGVRHEEFQSLVRLLQSQLDVSLAGILGQGDAKRAGT